MKKDIIISGFADEICADFEEQLKTVTALGMDHICLRAADGRGIADYTADEAREKLLPKLKKAGVKVSSIGSPIGKVDIGDEESFQRQLAQLDEICRMCGIFGCRYVRIFSFFMPKDGDPAAYRDAVFEKMEKFLEIGRRYGVTLIHENEKGIYGDTGSRCVEIMERFASGGMRSAYDFANFVQCGEDPGACWNMLKPYISYIHVKDALYTSHENVLCGTGDGRIREILDQAVNRDGYEGFLTLEPHLAVFSTFASLEKGGENEPLKNRFRTGAEAYGAQYRALCGILKEIGLGRESHE